MSDERACRVIKPPNRLAAKVPRAGGPELAEVTKQAERDLRWLQDRYIQNFTLDIDRMSDALEHARSDSEDAVRI